MEIQRRVFSRRAESSTTRVHLTGGLGNQLFQLAAGLFVSAGHPVELVPTYGGPRLDHGGRPEIASLNLGADVGICSWQDASLTGRAIRKLINVCLRSSSTPELSGVGQMQKSLTLKCASKVLGHLIGDSRVICSSNVGFDTQLGSCGQDVFLIGYFQTWRTASDDRVRGQILRMLHSSDESPWVESMREQAAREHPTVLHLRLGDYRDNPQFGKLHLDYFTQGLELLRESTDLGRIWIFSDEPEQAQHMLKPLVAGLNPRVIHVEPSHSSRDVLHTMSFGKSFVLSNSTFGWWAANLSNYESPKVVVPTPWFIDGTTVRDLVPTNWIQVDRA